MLEFLNLFWLSDGYRCVGLKSSCMQQFYFETNEEAAAFIEQNRNKAGELYFSPAIYKTAERKQANVKSIQAFWLDIDCGEGKGYKTQQDGINAVGQFIKSTNLPSPYIVSSGKGLHVYWVLQTPLAPDYWLGLANRFKSLCVFEGLKADPSRTADSASLLRPVGTYNNKSKPPTQVYFILKSKPCTIEDFSVLFKLKEDDRSKAIAAGVEKADFPDTDLTPIVEKCAVIADAVKKRGAVEEPIWRGMLSVVYRCVNGAQNIHELSKGDPRYSFVETKKKAEGTGGPYTCEQFSSLCPDVCSKCPLYGKISSPIVLGLPTKVALPPEEECGKGKVERLVRTEHYEVTPKGILKHVDEEKSFYITVVPIWVKGVREKVRKYDESGNSSIRLDWVDLGGRYGAAVIPQASIYDGKAFTKWLAENNIRALLKGKVDNLQDYILECTQEIMRMGMVERYYESLGWTDDGFIIGDRCITKAGSVPASVSSSSSVSHLSVKGSKTAWINATRVLDKEVYWPHAFALLCSFGSPLIDLCKYQSAVISMVGQSGYGKTLAGSFALSVYGEPNLMMQAATATANAIGVQMSAHKNIPYFLDEVSAMPMSRIADFIYDATNGRAKEVLDKNRDLQQSEGWCLVPFVSSNKSILEMPTTYIQEAHRRRIIEVPFDTPIDQSSASILAEGFLNNYGTVADDFLQYVVQNKKAIKEQVEKFLKLDIMNKIPSVNRFGKWTIACAAIGGKIAKSLGLIQFDYLNVISKAVRTLDADSNAVKDDVQTAKSALCAYLYQNNGNINVWSSVIGAVDQTLVRSVVARFNPADDCFYMQKEVFSAVIRDAGVSMRNLEPWMKSVGIVSRPERLGSSLPYVICYVFPKDIIGAQTPTSPVQDKLLS